MAKDPKPEDSGSDEAADAGALIAKSRQPALGRQADRALGALARKIRTERDAARAQGGDEQAVKDLGAALRRVRAEIVRRSEADGGQDPAEADAGAAETGTAGARPARSPGLRTGRPGARKMPKPQSAEGTGAAPEPAAGTVRAPKISRQGAGDADAAEASPASPRTGGMAAPPARKAQGGAGKAQDQTERKARKEAEKAERKRVKEAEKAEEKAARKAQKDAEKAARKAGTPGGEEPGA